MNEFWFQIVRRSRNSYEWIFVGARDGRPRVLARAGRDYRSRKKVRRAIRRLRDELPDAEVRRPYRLPRTSFHVEPGVLPLVVESPSSAGTAAAQLPRASSARTSRRQRDEATEPEPKQRTRRKDDAEPRRKPTATTTRRRRAT